MPSHIMNSTTFPGPVYYLLYNGYASPSTWEIKQAVIKDHEHVWGYGGAGGTIYFFDNGDDARYEHCSMVKADVEAIRDALIEELYAEIKDEVEKKSAELQDLLAEQQDIEATINRNKHG